MKTDFSKFELSKTAMNTIQGGYNHMQECHCGGSSENIYFTSEGALPYDFLEEEMDKRCDNGGWACRPV